MRELTLALATTALTLLTGLGVVLGYHRLLTHRAACFHPVVEKALVLFGLATGTPVQWVGNHRFHHAHVDTARDPHSPKHRGFWIAHCGWYLGLTEKTPASTALCVLYALAGPLRPLFDAFWRPRTNQEHVGLANDVAADRFYAWLSRPGPYALVLLSWVALLWTVFVVVWGVAGAGALIVVHYLAYALGDGINSLGHMWGEKSDAQGAHAGAREGGAEAGESRDSALLALLTLGDGWHRAHHRFPGSIRCGLAPGQLDVAYLVAKAFEAVGLATGLRVPDGAAPAPGACAPAPPGGHHPPREATP